MSPSLPYRLSFINVADYNIMHLEQFHDDMGVVEEIFEINGTVFYFRRTATYTYSSQLSSLGYYDFAFRYNESHTVYAGIIHLYELFAVDSDAYSAHARSRSIHGQAVALSESVINNLSYHATNIITFDIVVYSDDLISIEKIAFDNYGQTWFDELSTPVPFSPVPQTFPTIDALMRAFPSPYFGRLIGSPQTQTRGGRLAVGRLEQSYGLSHSRVSSINYVIGMSLSVISTLAGISFSTVVAVVSAVAGIVGTIHAAVTGTMWIHNLFETTLREFRVSNRTYETAFDEVLRRMVQGDRGWAVCPQIERRLTCAHFFDTPIMIHRGFNNYFWRNWGL
jgi:hypothetical protein